MQSNNRKISIIRFGSGINECSWLIESKQSLQGKNALKINEVIAVIIQCFDKTENYPDKILVGNGRATRMVVQSFLCDCLSTCVSV